MAVSSNKQLREFLRKRTASEPSMIHLASMNSTIFSLNLFFVLDARTFCNNEFLQLKHALCKNAFCFKHIWTVKDFFTCITLASNLLPSVISHIDFHLMQILKDELSHLPHFI